MPYLRLWFWRAYGLISVELYCTPAHDLKCLYFTCSSVRKHLRWGRGHGEAVAMETLIQVAPTGWKDWPHMRETPWRSLFLSVAHTKRSRAYMCTLKRKIANNVYFLHRKWNQIHTHSLLSECSTCVKAQGLILSLILAHCVLVSHSERDRNRAEDLSSEF